MSASTMPLPSNRCAVVGRRVVRPVLAAGTLRLYTKPSCPLCEGLQSKLEALKQRSQFMPTSPMVDVTLQVCDISADASLETRYGMHVPVLTWFGGGKDSKPNHMHPSNRTAGDGGAEVELERPSPRVGADQLERHLTKHIARAPQ